MRTLTTLVESSHNQLTLLNAFTTPKRLAGRFSWTMNIIPTNAKLLQSRSDFEDDWLETLWGKLKTEDDDKNNTTERMQQHNYSTQRQNNTKPDQKVLHGYTTAAAAALASGLDRCRTEDAGINLKEFQVKHTCAASVLRSIIWRSDEKHVKLMRMMMMVVVVLQRWAPRDQSGKRGDSTD